VNNFPGENQRRPERRRASWRQFESGMVNGRICFGEERMCQEVECGEGGGVRWRVCIGTKESETFESRDCEDSTEIKDVRGERGNANLIEWNKLAPFDLSSDDFFEEFEDDDEAVVLDDDPRNSENAGSRCRCWGVGRSDVGQCMSGDTIMSSMSNSSSGSNTELALEVDIERRDEEVSSSSSAE